MIRNALVGVITTLLMYITYFDVLRANTKSELNIQYTKLSFFAQLKNIRIANRVKQPITHDSQHLQNFGDHGQ